MILVLAGCTHYSPRPKPPEKVAADFISRSFDDAGLHEALNKALPARAADWPRQQWDRADLLFAMLYFNDSVAEGRAAVGVATAGQVTARQLPNPTVQLAGEYANQHDGSPLWLWGVTTEWLLDYGLRRGTRIAAADLSGQQARYDFAELAWRTRVALRRALADMFLAEREVTLLEQIRTDRGSQLEMARRQLELGAVGRGDVDRIVSDALLDEQKLNDSRRRASAARSAVAAAVGVPVEVLEKIRMGWPDLDTPPEISPQPLGQWREQALLERGDIRSAVTGYSVSEAALRLEIRKQYPDISVGPGYTWDHGVKRVQLNLLLTLPLLNRNQGAIAEAEARREQAGAKLEAAVAEAYSQIDAGFRQWQLARTRLAEAHGSIYETAQRIYSAMEQGFAAGANDRTELVAARIARTLTELQVLDAVRAAQEALGELEDAMRRPLEGPELSFDAAKWAMPGGRQ